MTNVQATGGVKLNFVVFCLHLTHVTLTHCCMLCSLLMCAGWFWRLPDIPESQWAVWAGGDRVVGWGVCSPRHPRRLCRCRVLQVLDQSALMKLTTNQHCNLQCSLKEPFWIIISNKSANLRATFVWYVQSVLLGILSIVMSVTLIEMRPPSGWLYRQSKLTFSKHVTDKRPEPISEHF